MCSASSRVVAQARLSSPTRMPPISLFHIALNLRAEFCPLHSSCSYEIFYLLSSPLSLLYLIGCFLYSIIRSGTPSYIASNLRPYSFPCPHSRASPLDLTVSFCRRSIFQRSFQCAGTSLWNSLPIAIRSSSSLHLFERELFCYLRQHMTN